MKIHHSGHVRSVLRRSFHINMLQVMILSVVAAAILAATALYIMQKNFSAYFEVDQEQQQKTIHDQTLQLRKQIDQRNAPKSQSSANALD